MGEEMGRRCGGSIGRLALAVAVTGALALALPAAGYAGTIGTWGSWNGSAAFSDFGSPNTTTYGQVVTVPPGQVSLESFAFYVDLSPQLIFRPYVYAWNGHRATGADLYEGPELHSTEEGAFQPITVETGGVSLTPGEQYVLFFSMSNDAAADESLELDEGAWGGGIEKSVYGEGEWVYINNGYRPPEWTETEWDSYDGGYGASPSEPTDMNSAFTAVFATQQEVTAKKTAEAEAAAKKKAEAEASAKKTAELEAAVKKLTELEAKEKAEAEAKKKAEEEAKTTVVLDDSAITVSNAGKAPVKLTCTGVGTCVGKLTLELKGTTGTGKNKHSKTQVVGGASFSIAAGKTETVEVTLDGTGRSLLKAAAGHLAGTLVILKSAPGASTTKDDSVHVSEKLKKHK